MSGRDQISTAEAVLLGIGAVIVGVWAIAVLVQVVSPSHVVPTEVHGIMIVLIPLLFGGALLASRKDKP